MLEPAPSLSLLARAVAAAGGPRVLHDALSPGQREALRYSWEANGRPMVPAGQRVYRAADGSELKQDVYKGQLLADLEHLPWSTAFAVMGRGAGKSMLACQYARHVAEHSPGAVICLMGETATSTRQTLGFGKGDGLANITPPWNRPLWSTIDQAFVWPNKSIAFLMSADAPQKPRSYEFDLVVLDEAAFYRQLDVIIANVSFALRAGPHPRLLVCTTPRSSGTLRALRDGPNTILLRGSLYDNRAFLPASYIKNVEDKFRGTSLERAELYGDPAACDEVSGALFRRAWLDRFRVKAAPPLRRVVVGVDPSASEARQHDVAGIVTVGLGENGECYVVADDSGESGVLTPREWATRAAGAFHAWHCSHIIEESNRGGALASSLIKAVDSTVIVKTIGSQLNKTDRATPIAAQFEAGHVHLVGVHPQLEDELCGWDPAAPGAKSPGRMDALVFACTELLLKPPPLHYEPGTLTFGGRGGRRG